jgi:thiol-disulfide isomerase/thioredoxin
MSNVTLVNDTEFDTLVVKGKKTALVFFSAVWSAPCKMRRPDLEQTTGENSYKLAFYEIDAGSNMITPARYDIYGRTEQK